MFWMMLACAEDPSEQCNDADSYLHQDMQVDEDTWLTPYEQDLDEAGGGFDCDAGSGGVKMTSDWHKVCDAYIDAVGTYATCRDECSLSDETDEFRSCQDSCATQFGDDCKLESEGDCADAQVACEWNCPGHRTWTCD